MCCVIKGSAVPLFMIRISSDGMEATDFGQKMEESGGFGAKNGQNLGFSVELA